MPFSSCSSFFFFFNDTATTEIYTLSLHDALPISVVNGVSSGLSAYGIKVFPAAILGGLDSIGGAVLGGIIIGDRKSTRLNSSHGYISYAVFCLKKKTVEATDGTAALRPSPDSRFT